MYLFCEGWSCFGREVEVFCIKDYRAFCQRTQEIIREILPAQLVNQRYVKYLKIGWQFLEDMMAQMQIHQERAHGASRRDEMEDEQDMVVAGGPLRQDVGDLGEEHNRYVDRMIDSWEYNVRLEECMRRKLGKLQQLHQKLMTETLVDDPVGPIPLTYNDLNDSSNVGLDCRE
jgi:hypothetical protein